jgi:small basic protein
VDRYRYEYLYATVQSLSTLGGWDKLFGKVKAWLKKHLDFDIILLPTITDETKILTMEFLFFGCALGLSLQHTNGNLGALYYVAIKNELSLLTTC